MNMLTASILALVLHESGHLLSAWMLGVKVKRIGFGWLGPYVVREAGPPERNLAVTLSGPLANALTLYLCSGSFAATLPLWERLCAMGCNPVTAALLLYWRMAAIHPLYVASMGLLVWNLLPVRFSDGGRALNIIMALFNTQRKEGTA